MNLNPTKKIAVVVLFAFLVNTFGPLPLAHADDFVLPAPGTMVHLSPAFNPPVLKGIKVHPENPFRFEFILDKGDSQLVNDQLKAESTKLIKYFLSSITLPEKDLWVNLSPYEKNRIIPHSFGLTEMGRDLLAEDYMLKQITASLIYPEDIIGKKFWKRVYEEAANKYGTTNIPIDTFNKVWIVPEKAVVYENAKAGTAYVVESKLKVMLEQDYLSLQKHEGINSIVKPQGKETNQLGSQIVREVVIPELTIEVNENKNFAQLRQVYNSLILATWYKKKIKDSILEQVYADKNKVAGVNIDDPQEKERIYQRYLQAFKKGAYNFIKEERDPLTQQTVPRKYFSGGMLLVVPKLDYAMALPADAAMAAQPMSLVEVDIAPSTSVHRANVLDFKPLRNKHFIVLDDDKDIVDMYRRFLADHVPEDQLFVGTSPQEGLERIREWTTKKKVPSKDIVVLTDYQFRNNATALDVINPLRVPSQGPVFEGPILIVSASLVDKTQMEGFENGNLTDSVKKRYGLRFLEKNGQRKYDRLLLEQLLEASQTPLDPADFAKEPMVTRMDTQIRFPPEVSVFLGRINGFEALLGEALDNLERRSALHNAGEDISSLIRQIREHGEFGNINREMGIEDRIHAYRNPLHWTLINPVSSLRKHSLVQQEPQIGEQLRQVVAILEAMRDYTKFLHELFIHMRGLNKLNNAFLPLLQSVIGQYQHDFEGKPTPEFDPEQGIAMALEKLSKADEKMQRGIVQDAMIEWGRLYGRYKTIKTSFDEILLGKAGDLRTVAFMDSFSRQLNNFFGQYIKRFGLVNLIGAQGGAKTGQIIIVQGNAEDVRRQLQEAGKDTIVVMDLDDTTFSTLNMEETQINGFVFGGEGGGHLITAAGAMEVPLIILPNAVEYFRQFNRKDEWVLVDSSDGHGVLRFLSPQERDIAPVLQRQPIVAQPVRRDTSGPLMLGMGNEGSMSIEEMAEKMGYKAANQYANSKVARVPTTDTLCNRFIEELMAENPELKKELEAEFNFIDKSKPDEVKDHLAQMQKIIARMKVSDKKKDMIWTRLGSEFVGSMKTTPYLILRLSTGAEDLEDFPGVGAGVYGSFELIPWAVKISDSEWEIPQENKDNLINKMLEAYASYWSFEAYANRRKFGIKHWEVGQALMFQEYMHEAKYSVLVHTADPSRRDRNVIRIEIVPGAGRGLTASNPDLEGTALTVYYDKTFKNPDGTIGKVIDKDDPREHYHPVALGKTNMVSLTTGEIIRIKQKDYPELKDFVALAKAIVPAVLRLEQLHQRALDIEGVIMPLDVWEPFVDVQSRAQRNIMPYEPAFLQSMRVGEKRQEMVENLNRWLNEHGRADFQSLDFYKGEKFETTKLREFLPDQDVVQRASSLIPSLLAALGLRTEGVEMYENITLLYQFLMSSDEFADVREGILRRIFFYASWQHGQFIDYFRGLAKDQPDMFLKIFPYAIVPMLKDTAFNRDWFESVNIYLVGRCLTNPYLWDVAAEGLPTSEMVGVVNQLFRWGKSTDVAKFRDDFQDTIDYLYPLLGKRKDFHVLLGELLPGAAQEVRAANPDIKEPEKPPAQADAPVVELKPVAPPAPKTLSPFEQKKAKLNAWLNKYGRNNFQSLGFYKGKEFEASSLRKFFPTEGLFGRASELIPELLSALNLSFDHKNITALYELLMSSDEFSDIREGLLRRLFFYAQFQHADLTEYFWGLCDNQPDLFLKIIPYAIVPWNKDGLPGPSWFKQVNDFSLSRVFKTPKPVRVAMEGLSVTDIVSILNQYYTADDSVINPSFRFIVEDFGYPRLFQRPDFKQILSGLLPDVAERIRASYGKAHPDIPLEETSPASKALSPYEQKKAKLNDWINAKGRDNFKSLDFYKGEDFEAPSLRAFVPIVAFGQKSRLADELLAAVGLQLGLDFVGVTDLYQFLSADEFADVREGILRRVFFYARFQHAEIEMYFRNLAKDNRGLFFKIFPNAVMPMAKDSAFNQEWFEEANLWAMPKALNSPYIFKAVGGEGLTTNELASVINQWYRWGRSEDVKKDLDSFEETKDLFYSLLAKRGDYKELLGQLLPGAAKDIRAANPNSDLAMTGKSALDGLAIQRGGIDLTAHKNSLEIQNSGQAIKFHLDPAMLKQLQDAPGFVPVIINIQPMRNLRRFLTGVS